MRSSLNTTSIFTFFYALCAHQFQADAFDYLEHLYLSDRVCVHVVRLIESQLIDDSREPNQTLLTRYLALNLVCPETRRETPYCDEGTKLVVAPLLPLSSPPQESGEYSLTLGDITALPDHVGEFGITPGLPRAESYGLTSIFIELIAEEDGGLTGTLYDVAEDACEGAHLVDWIGVDSDVDRVIEDVFTHQKLPQFPIPYLSSRARAPLQQGPRDPAALYSFDNPHYLDLVFRNHHHFGEQAYQAWLGFHSVGIELANTPCAELINPDPDWLEDLADSWPVFDQLDWHQLDLVERKREGCALLSQLISSRLSRWSESYKPELLSKLTARYPHFQSLVKDDESESTSQLKLDLVSALLSLVYEGSGLHFHQDSLAGGHMRTIRTRGGLQEARYDHDADNRDGVIATYQTADSTRQFIAYGDSYLLGRGPQSTLPVTASTTDPCTMDQEEPNSPVKAARCALFVQRGLIASATLGSLVDWAQGGAFYTSPASREEERSSDLHLLKATLPVSPPTSAPVHAQAPQEIKRANLPIPPPDFSYQVLSHRYAFDLAGSTPRLGVQLTLLDTLGSFAHWLSSYRFGLHTDLGEGDLNRWSLDAGYAFHFRWAARFTIDLGLSAHMGWREFSQDVDWYTGITPIAGLTLLPEGWIKIPLEINISYQIPLTFYDQGVGFPGDNMIEGHYLGVGLGLAFMK